MQRTDKEIKNEFKNRSFECQMAITTRYSITVAFRKDHGLQEKDSFQP